MVLYRVVIASHMAHLRKSLKGAGGLPEEDGEHERRGRKANLRRSHRDIKGKSNKSTRSTTKTKNEIIKSVAIGIVCAAMLQLLLVFFLLSEDTDEWRRVGGVYQNEEFRRKKRRK